MQAVEDPEVEDPELDRRFLAVNTALCSEAALRPLAEPPVFATRHEQNSEFVVAAVGFVAAVGPDLVPNWGSQLLVPCGYRRSSEPASALAKT